MAKKNDKLTKSTAELDLERRLAEEKNEDDGQGRDFAVEGNDLDNYVGVSPEYQTYANETEAPLTGDGKSAEEVFAQRHRDGMAERADNSARVGVHGYNVNTTGDDNSDKDSETNSEEVSGTDDGKDSQSSGETPKAQGQGQSAPQGGTNK